VKLSAAAPRNNTQKAQISSASGEREREEGGKRNWSRREKRSDTRAREAADSAVRLLDLVDEWEGSGCSLEPGRADRAEQSRVEQSPRWRTMDTCPSPKVSDNLFIDTRKSLRLSFMMLYHLLLFRRGISSSLFTFTDPVWVLNVIYSFLLATAPTCTSSGFTFPFMAGGVCACVCACVCVRVSGVALSAWTITGIQRK